jgi:hypothetical protein
LEIKFKGHDFDTVVAMRVESQAALKVLSQNTTSRKHLKRQKSWKLYIREEEVYFRVKVACRPKASFFSWQH